MIAWLYRNRFWASVGLFIVLNGAAKTYIQPFVCTDGALLSAHDVCAGHGVPTLHTAWLMAVAVSFIVPAALWLCLAQWHRRQNRLSRPRDHT
jgi:hypothetical protein